MAVKVRAGQCIGGVTAKDLWETMEVGTANENCDLEFLGRPFRYGECLFLGAGAVCFVCVCVCVCVFACVCACVGCRLIFIHIYTKKTCTHMHTRGAGGWMQTDIYIYIYIYIYTHTHTHIHTYTHTHTHTHTQTGKGGWMQTADFTGSCSGVMQAAISIHMTQMEEEGFIFDAWVKRLRFVCFFLCHFCAHDGGGWLFSCDLDETIEFF